MEPFIVIHVRAVNILFKTVADHAMQDHFPHHILLQCALLATQDFLHLVVLYNVPHVLQTLILLMEHLPAKAVL